jgi:hypothetical protein
MNRHVQGILILGLAACGGAPAAWNQPANALAIEREAVTWYERWHESRAQGDAKAWAAGFAPDGVYIGPAASDVFVGGQAIGAALARRPAAPGLTRTLATNEVSAGLGDDGRSVWLADVLDERVRVDDAPAARGVLLNTTLIEHNGQRWRVVLAHESRALPEEDALLLAEGGRFPEPTELVDNVAETAGRLAEIMSASLAGADVFRAALSRRPGTLAFGPGPDERYLGTQAIGEWLQRLLGQDARLVRSSGIRAGIAAGGKLGWVALNIDLATVRAGLEVRRPGRLTAILAREGNDWAIVQVHLSHAQPEAE